MTDNASAIPRDSRKRIFASGTPEQLEARYASLHATDKRVESIRFVLIFVAIAGGVAVVVGMASETPWMFLSALVVGVGALVARWLIGHHDIEDRKLEVARTLVDTLKTELRPGRPVEVMIDFRGYWRYKIDEPWLTVKMTLENGVVAEVTGLDRCKRKSKSKRKYTKIKDKIISSLVVRFTPPKGKTLDAGLQVSGKRPSVGPLQMRSSKISPRGATFVYSTGAVVRLKGRAGWSEGNYASHMPKGRHAVQAVIASYHLLGRAGAEAAAGAQA